MDLTDLARRRDSKGVDSFDLVFTRTDPSSNPTPSNLIAVEEDVQSGQSGNRWLRSLSGDECLFAWEGCGIELKKLVLYRLRCWTEALTGIFASQLMESLVSAKLSANSESALVAKSVA